MFIVLEGIDGAGKGRQRTELLSHLDADSVPYETTDFPDHNGVLYEHLIHPALHREIEMPAEAMFVSFALDQMLWQPRIRKAKGSDKTHFIADGYYTTNIAYQCILQETFPLQTALDFAQTFKIEQPDLVLFIDVDPDKAMERKNQEEGHDEGPDMFEADINKQQIIRNAFLKMAKDDVFGDWVIVDGNGDIQEVFANIKAALKEQSITF